MITHISCKSSLLEPASQLSFQKVATEVCNSVESLKCVEHYYWCCSELLYRVLYCIGLCARRTLRCALRCGAGYVPFHTSSLESTRDSSDSSRHVLY